MRCSAYVYVIFVCQAYRHESVPVNIIIMQSHILAQISMLVAIIQYDASRNTHSYMFVPSANR